MMLAFYRWTTLLKAWWVKLSNQQSHTTLKMQKISKHFGEVIANQDVDFLVDTHRIHALLGENGAGKSTLMNVLAGIYQQDSGTITIDDKICIIDQPATAAKLGIGMVHQHFKLQDNLSVLDNIIAQSSKGFFRTSPKKRKAIQDSLDQVGIKLDLDAMISELSVAQKQCVEIAKVLYLGASLLVFDEPTAVLAPLEIEQLYLLLAKLKAQGCAIIMITHKLQEVLTYCDDVTILRKGRSVFTGTVEGIDETFLTEMMVGDRVNLHIERLDTKPCKELLQVQSISLMSKDKFPILDDITFSLYDSEILGIAGISGSGQKELCEAIVGMLPIDKGDILFENESITNLSCRKISDKGISLSFIPEDRLQMGLVDNMGIVDNLLLKSYYKQPGHILCRSQARKDAIRLVEKLAIVTPSIDTPVSLLSGGNIQKVLLGREIDLNPKVIITAYAVRGLDVMPTHQVYDLLNAQKQRGCGILFIGEDLDVLSALCDRIAVLCDGKLMGIVDARSSSKMQLGQMMSGIKRVEDEYEV